MCKGFYGQGNLDTSSGALGQNVSTDLNPSLDPLAQAWTHWEGEHLDPTLNP